MAPEKCPGRATRLAAREKRAEAAPSVFVVNHSQLSILDSRNPLEIENSGRWLEAVGFKGGAEFAAVGVEGGLLVLTSWERRLPDPLSDDGWRDRVLKLIVAADGEATLKVAMTR